MLKANVSYYFHVFFALFSNFLFQILLLEYLALIGASEAPLALDANECRYNSKCWSARSMLYQRKLQTLAHSLSRVFEPDRSGNEMRRQIEPERIGSLEEELRLCSRRIWGFAWHFRKCEILLFSRSFSLIPNCQTGCRNLLMISPHPV